MTGLVCYCFGYSEEDIREDYLENGKSMIMEKIQMEKNSVIASVRLKIQKGNDAYPMSARWWIKSATTSRAGV